ncbi:MAG: hypothetical protein ABI650_03705, partial [Dokdonella sp.]
RKNRSVSGMSFVVVSSHESNEGKDLQQPGESIAVLANEGHARERYQSRIDALARTAGKAKAEDSTGAIMWVVLLKLPIPAEDIAGELDDLVVAYHGMHFTATGVTEYPRERAIENLHAWLV